MDEGRKADIKELEKIRATAPDKETLHNVKKVEKTIKDEQHNGWLRSARESLVKAAKSGKTGNIHEVQDRMILKREKNRGMQTKLNISEERHKEIFG